MQLYNTLSRRKEPFQPLRPGKVGLYACGVTVYDDCHLGHARSTVVFEVLVRYLRRRGLEVTWVRNFTDIDDKIIRRAQETGKAWLEVAERYIASFQEDMAALGVPPAQIEPRATEHIPEIIDLIRRPGGEGLCLSGPRRTSISGCGAFPATANSPARAPEDLESGARVEVDPHKEDPLDFVLWKGSKPGEPAWDSPWGPGRPGWHIECSAMAMRYLGETLDLHGGGQDLVFPHHENELAQSEAATGKPFARFWLHHGLLTINQEKMSKSLGNFFTVKEVLAKFPAEVVRFFLINAHYRSPLDFSDAALAEAETALLRLYTTLARLEEVLGQYPDVALPRRNLITTRPTSPWRNAPAWDPCRAGSTTPWTTTSTPPRPWVSSLMPSASSTACWRNNAPNRAISPSSATCTGNSGTGRGPEPAPGRPRGDGPVPAPETPGPANHPGRDRATHRRPHPGPERQGLGPGGRHPQRIAG